MFKIMFVTAVKMGDETELQIWIQCGVRLDFPIQPPPMAFKALDLWFDLKT